MASPQLLSSPRDWNPAASQHYGGPAAVENELDDLCESMEQLLQRGERYCAPHSLRYVTLKETWYWTPRNDEDEDVRYLDASALLFGANQKFLEFIDYSDQRSSNNTSTRAAVRHSGDQIDRDECKGEHTINVDLALLSPQVREIFITISSFGGHKLVDIESPTVSFVDGQTDEPLCSYELSEQDQESLADYSGIVMCRVYRTAGDETRWAVEALGHMGQGAAGNYGPMVQYISQCLPLANSLSSWGL